MTASPVTDNCFVSSPDCSAAIGHLTRVKIEVVVSEPVSIVFGIFTAAAGGGRARDMLEAKR
jgi:hypothetical protein